MGETSWLSPAQSPSPPSPPVLSPPVLSPPPPQSRSRLPGARRTCILDTEDDEPSTNQRPALRRRETADGVPEIRVAAGRCFHDLLVSNSSTNPLYHVGTRALYPGHGFYPTGRGYMGREQWRKARPPGPYGGRGRGEGGEGGGGSNRGGRPP